MKKIISVFTAFLMIICVFPVAVGAEVLETKDGIQYSVSDGAVTVEGFNYAGTVMDVPENIDGYPVKYIAPQACRGNTAITELRLPKGLASVGEYAFGECPNLTKVTMAGGSDIGRSAFRDCKALITLKLPSSLKSIDDFAFEGCTMLGKVKIPKGLSEIGTDAFAGCERVSFDVKSNSYAKEYARKNNIPTDFKDTWEFTLIMLALVTLLLGGAVFAANKLLKKRKK